MTRPITWARKHPGGYEVSSVGDKRFSALHATMPDGRTIEQWYQCDIKGYDVGGVNWRLGKGKPPKYDWRGEQLYEMYLSLWRLWALRHINLLEELSYLAKTNGNILTDCFANTQINQARALTQILNEWF